MNNTELIELIDSKIKEAKMIIFDHFCYENHIEPASFRRFIMLRYYSGWQILGQRAMLANAWKQYLACQYMNMIMEVEK